MSEGSFGDNGPFDERHQQVWRHMRQRQIEVGRQRRGTATQGKGTGGTSVRAGLAMVTSVHGAGHMTVADHELRLAMHRARHETRGDQRMGEKRNERQCHEAPADRSTKNFGPIAAHTVPLCSARPKLGKRGEHRMSCCLEQGPAFGVNAHLRCRGRPLPSGSRGDFVAFLGALSARLATVATGLVLVMLVTLGLAPAADVSDHFGQRRDVR